MSNIFLSTVAYPDPTCEKWFVATKIRPEEKDCILKCTTALTDLATFSCTSRCRALCLTSIREGQSKRETNFWEKRIISGKPAGWPHRHEKSKAWSEPEKKRLLKALERMPDALWLEKIEGIYRLDKSHDQGNRASSATAVMVLYDRAFDPDADLAAIVSHELAHERFRQMEPETRFEYAKSTGWSTREMPNGETVPLPRKSGYVKPDGNTSPAEDFANNVEIYLFDRSRLKSVTPTAHDWIHKFFGDSFKLRHE